MHSLELGRPYGRHEDVISREEASACARLGGEPDDGRVPLGIAFVLALRTLIDAHFLPPGAIMAGHRVRWGRLPAIGERVVTEVSVSALEPARRRLVVHYTTSDRDGRAIIEQEQDVRWPSMP